MGGVMRGGIGFVSTKRVVAFYGAYRGLGSSISMASVTGEGCVVSNGSLVKLVSVGLKLPVHMIIGKRSRRRTGRYFSGCRFRWSSQGRLAGAGCNALGRRAIDLWVGF